eukprot:m.198663 g.198663  ORF g.198663 m.198663 type:complete len:98 (+) comp32702_c1_seq5:446-739(+)
MKISAKLLALKAFDTKVSTASMLDEHVREVDAVGVFEFCTLFQNVTPANSNAFGVRLVNTCAVVRGFEVVLMCHIMTIHQYHQHEESDCELTKKSSW